MDRSRRKEATLREVGRTNSRSESTVIREGYPGGDIVSYGCNLEKELKRLSETGLRTISKIGIIGMKRILRILNSKLYGLPHLKGVSGDLFSLHYEIAPHDEVNGILRKALISILRKACLTAKKYKNRMCSFASRNKVMSPPTLNIFKNRQSPLFFVHAQNAQPSTLFEKLTYPMNAMKVIEDANEVCEHTFQFLGSDKISIGPRIPWHTDFKTGHIWPLKFYLDMLPIDPIDISTEKKLKYDLKIPYELSRFQHLPTLGKAYWFTGDEKYAREFFDEINDWIENNPYPYGVNWTCSMDIAIRAVNWVWGFYFFRDSPETTDQFLLNFQNSLLHHGKHIEENLERTSRAAELVNSILIHGRLDLDTLRSAWRGTNTNHYLSGIVGLVYLGILFAELGDTKRWRNFGVKELINEMGKQVFPDGVDCEGSISYHRLVTELFVSATLLCLNNRIALPTWYTERLERMFEFVMYYTKPDGTAPQIGDNDDGRLHILSNYGNWNRLDHRYLLSIGAVLFNRPDFKERGGKFHEEAFWLVGDEGLKKFKGLPDRKTPVNSRAFVEGGFYILRRDSLYMIVDCVSRDRRASSGHKHNSLLSFELFAYDKTFIVDPGAYIYTADKEMRNLFRSTKYHNTVVIDGEEQNRIDKNELFKIEPDASVRVSKWESTPEYDILIAEHTGYGRLKKPVIHRREIFFNKTKGFWVVRDLLNGEGDHHYDLYFHLSPIDIEFEKDLPLAMKTKTCGSNLAIIPFDREGISVEVTRGWVSYQYGVKVEAPIVKYSKKGIAPMSFCNILYPYIQSIDLSEVFQEVRSWVGTRLENDLQPFIRESDDKVRPFVV